ncbi:MAG: hypothetical protein K5880_21995 [Hydrogenophaga sp.]|uniref:hypothetical protein n=1 Tax=Hydrogenophaga sp. TaxID=1904254 RepID=UPI00261E1A44|nr:hypothetical protein [Hydrogenophaga sp.]MCV0441275.1 hypothetical protein [Hydrogenophaga sp.]
MLCCEMEHLREDLAGKRNSDQAKAYISQALRRLGGARTLAIKPRSFKISKGTADALREIEHEHNLVRDALVNRLIVLMRGRRGLLRALDLPDAVRWSSDYGSTLHVGPLPNLLEVLSDPLYNLRVECQRVHGCGLHALDLPPELVGLSLYLEDEDVPGTDASALREAWAAELNMLADAERFTDGLTPIRPRT